LYQNLISSFQIVGNFAIENIQKQISGSRVKVRYHRNLINSRVYLNIHSYQVEADVCDGVAVDNICCRMCCIFEQWWVLCCSHWKICQCQVLLLVWISDTLQNLSIQCWKNIRNQRGRNHSLAVCQ